MWLNKTVVRILYPNRRSQLDEPRIAASIADTPILRAWKSWARISAAKKCALFNTSVGLFLVNFAIIERSLYPLFKTNFVKMFGTPVEAKTNAHIEVRGGVRERPAIHSEL